MRVQALYVVPPFVVAYLAIDWAERRLVFLYICGVGIITDEEIPTGTTS